MKEIDLDDLFGLTEEQKMLQLKKQNISKVVFQRMTEKGISMKKISDEIEGIGTAQVSRIVHGENYNIHTLIKILDFLDLELSIVQKKDGE